MITRQTVRNQILAYLNREITLAQLVDWAEDTMSEGALEQRDAPVLAETIARIGAADVEGLGLTWEDCYSFLSRLGYKIEVVKKPGFFKKPGFRFFRVCAIIPNDDISTANRTADR